MLTLINKYNVHIRVPSYQHKRFLSNNISFKKVINSLCKKIRIFQNFIAFHIKICEIIIIIGQKIIHT